MDLRSRKPREYRLYGMFNHPIRARMIELLGQRGPTSFTELRKEIPVSVGSLYYHLSVLGELLSQDERKRYQLNETGLGIFQHLKKGSLALGSPPLQGKLPIGERLAPLVTGSLLLQGVSLAPLRHIGVAALIIGVGSWVTLLAGLDARLLFLFETRGQAAATAAISFGLGWAVVYVVSDVVATTVFKSRGGHLSLLVGSTYALLPLILFGLIWALHKTGPLSVLGLFDGWPLRVLFFALQAWTVVLLASSIRMAKRLTVGRSFAIVLLVVYLNIAFILAGRVP